MSRSSDKWSSDKRKEPETGQHDPFAKRRPLPSHSPPSVTAPIVQLVICTSGVYGEDLNALERACSRLDARLTSVWSDTVTHLVMPKISWSPKLLSALAGLRPVVSLKWVLTAAQDPSTPLPDAADPVYAPASSGHSTDGVVVVRPERAKLFHGRRFVCLPGGHADCGSLLSKMGASVIPWAETEAVDVGVTEYAAERVREGYGFLLPGDEKWPTTPEAKAAVATGGEVISPLVVRTSLIMAKVSSLRLCQTSSATARGAGASSVSSMGNSNGSVTVGAAVTW